MNDNPADLGKLLGRGIPLSGELSGVRKFQRYRNRNLYERHRAESVGGRIPFGNIRRFMCG
jgi:hypothetical protein